MTRRLLTLAVAGMALLLPETSPALAAPAAASSPIGTWINPHGTVKVQTGECAADAGKPAGGLCGWVVWAAPKAEADARDSGVTRLLGTELLRGYRSAGHGVYKGEVYVPDMGRSFLSTIEQRGANDLKISGCILGGLICRSQDWHRA